jgi:hypothetical protein
VRLPYDLLKSLKPRIGCAFCFNTLNPDDPDESRRTFLKCGNCGVYYHKVCYERCALCLHCGSLAAPTTIQRPVQLPAVTLHPKRIRGHSAVESGGRSTSILSVINAISLMLFSSIRWVAISAIFVVSITAISSYIYRLVTLRNASIQVVLDAVLRSELPPTPIWGSALVAALLAGYTFYPAQLNDRAGNSAPVRYITRFLGSAVALVLYNVLLFEMYFQDIVTFRPNREQTDILMGEGAAIVLTFLAGFLRRAIYRIDSNRPVPSIAKAFLNIVGIWRFYLVSGLVIILAAVVAVRELPVSLNSPQWATLPLPGIRIALTMPVIVALITSIFCGLLIYLPPIHSPAQRKLWLFRASGLIVSVAGVVLAYRATQNVDGFLNVLVFAGIAALALLPLQRAFS